MEGIEGCLILVDPRNPGFIKIDFSATPDKWNGKYLSTDCTSKDGPLICPGGIMRIA